MTAGPTYTMSTCEATLSRMLSLRGERPCHSNRARRDRRDSVSAKPHTCELSRIICSHGPPTPHDLPGWPELVNQRMISRLVRLTIRELTVTATAHYVKRALIPGTAGNELLDRAADIMQKRWRPRRLERDPCESPQRGAIACRVGSTEYFNAKTPYPTTRRQLGDSTAALYSGVLLLQRGISAARAAQVNPRPPSVVRCRRLLLSASCHPARIMAGPAASAPSRLARIRAARR
jgi:hypothetical protein